MRSDLEVRYSIGEPSHENEFVVYPATDKRMGWSVSIVEPDFGLKADKERLQRAWTSINDAKSLPSQRFVEILDLIAPTELDENFYVVEKRPSRTLRQYIEEQEIIDFDRAAEIARHILEGLATLHGAGYAHNALTDRCLYVSEDYSGLSVRIGNLHLVSRIGEAIVPPYAPEFGAPDLYRPGTFHASPAADVYSAGMIAYKLFLPSSTYADVFQEVMVWEEEHQREQNWKNIHVDETKVFPRLDTLVPGFPAALAALVERMLSRDPAQRPRDATEALAEFRRASDGVVRRFGNTAPPPISGATPVARKPPARRWSPVKIAAFAALALVALGIGAVTVPMLLKPDPELVRSVEEWQKAAETRRSMAVAAKAPERASADPARQDFDVGSQAMQAAAASIAADEDYDAALAGYQKAVDDFGRSLAGIALAEANDAREAAKRAGGEKAPAFAASDEMMTQARGSIEAGEHRAAIDRLNEARTGFAALAANLNDLAKRRTAAEAKRQDAVRAGGDRSPDFAAATKSFDAAVAAAGTWNFAAAGEGFAAAGTSYDRLGAAMRALGEAKTAATGKRETAQRIGASESPGFPKAAGLFDDASAKAERWELAPAETQFREAAKAFDALIAEVMAAKDAAAAMKRKVADLDAALVLRAGADEPALVALKPRIADADERFASEAYKLALAAYEPILKDLEGLGARGFCPAPPDFRSVDAGRYPLANVRLMTSSLTELGDMLGVANGAARVDKPFCIGTRLVTRGDMAAFRAADGQAAEDGGGDTGQPADDVTWQDANRYAEWMSGRLGAKVRLPSAQEWMAGATIQPNDPPASNNDDIVLQWTGTPCEDGGYVAFLAQAGSTFAVCSDAGTGGIFRVIADPK